MPRNGHTVECARAHHRGSGHGSASSAGRTLGSAAATASVILRPCKRDGSRSFAALLRSAAAWWQKLPISHEQNVSNSQRLPDCQRFTSASSLPTIPSKLTEPGTVSSIRKSLTLPASGFAAARISSSKRSFQRESPRNDEMSVLCGNVWREFSIVEPRQASAVFVSE